MIPQTYDTAILKAIAKTKKDNYIVCNIINKLKGLTMTTLYDFAMETIEGSTQSLNQYEGKVVVVVNTASKCGLTPQFKALEALYQNYKDQGLVILGFPCNQFANQDPAENTEIAAFCEKNYGVTFPMFSKIEVNGDKTAPLFEYLKEDAPGLLGSKGIKWNFTKFVINRHGQVVKRFAPKDKPEAMTNLIESLLAN